MVKTVTLGAVGLALAQKLVDRWPSKVAKFPRPAFDKEVTRLDHMVGFTWDGYTCMVSLNYCCEGTFGPDQKVTFLNWRVTVWHPKTSLVSSYGSIRPGGRVLSMLKALRKKVDKLCPHEETEVVKRGLPHQCLTTYRCKKCGAVYEVDSSD